MAQREKSKTIYWSARWWFQKRTNHPHLGVSKNRGTPKWMIHMENPIKMDDLGVPPFTETSTRGNWSNLPIFQMGWFNHQLPKTVLNTAGKLQPGSATWAWQCGRQRRFGPRWWLDGTYIQNGGYGGGGWWLNFQILDELHKFLGEMVHSWEPDVEMETLNLWTFKAHGELGLEKTFSGLTRDSFFADETLLKRYMRSCLGDFRSCLQKTCGKCCASEDWVYILLCYCMPILAWVIYIYCIYIYMCVCVYLFKIYTLYFWAGCSNTTHRTNKKWFKYCIEWIGKFCHFLYWHRIPGDSPSVRCSTDWCSSVVKSKWLPMLDKRTIFPLISYQFPFPSTVIILYYTVMYHDISISHCITLSPSKNCFWAPELTHFCWRSQLGL